MGKRNMRKGLRKVAKLLTARAKLFRIKTEVIGIAQRLFKDETRLFQVTRAREAFDIPE